MPQDLVEVELPGGREMQPANARARQSREGMAEGWWVRGGINTPSPSLPTSECPLFLPLSVVSLM